MFVTTSNAVPGGCCRALGVEQDSHVFEHGATDGPVDNETKVYKDYFLPLITQTSYHACSGWLSSIFPFVGKREI